MKKSKYLLPRLDWACSKDDIRSALNYVFIDGKYAIASDGFIFVQLNLNSLNCFTYHEISMMNGLMIHRDVWKQIATAGSISIIDYKINAIYDYYTAIIDMRQPGAKFPDWKYLFEEIKNAENTDKFSFDPKKLNTIYRIAKTIPGFDMEFFTIYNTYRKNFIVKFHSLSNFRAYFAATTNHAETPDIE